MAHVTTSFQSQAALEAPGFPARKLVTDGPEGKGAEFSPLGLERGWSCTDPHQWFQKTVFWSGGCKQIDR